MDSTPTTDEGDRRKAIRAASILFLLHLASGAGIAYPVGYMLATRTFVPQLLWVSRPLSGFFGQPQTIDVMIALGLLWIGVSLANVVAGYWLWNSLKRGGILGAFLVPLGVFLGIGFGAPAYPIMHTLQGVLLAMGWKALR